MDLNLDCIIWIKGCMNVTKTKEKDEKSGDLKLDSQKLQDSWWLSSRGR